MWKAVRRWLSASPGGGLKRSRPTVPYLGLLDSDSARAEVILLEIVSLSFGSPWRWTWGLKNVSNVGLAHKKLRLTLTCLRCVSGKWVSVTTKIKGVVMVSSKFEQRWIREWVWALLWDFPVSLTRACRSLEEGPSDRVPSAVPPRSLSCICNQLKTPFLIFKRKITFILFVCVGGWGGQRTTSERWRSPSTLWVQSIQVTSSHQCLYLLRQL